MSAKPSSASRARRARAKPTRSNRPMPSRRLSRHSSASHPASINVPYTGSHGSASCHGIGDARRAKTAATTAYAPTAQATRANSISAGPRHVSMAASRRRRRALWEFGSMNGILVSLVKICTGDIKGRTPVWHASRRYPCSEYRLQADKTSPTRVNAVLQTTVAHSLPPRGWQYLCCPLAV
jgi:hypothetical protein